MLTLHAHQRRDRGAAPGAPPSLRVPLSKTLWRERSSWARSLFLLTAPRKRSLMNEDQMKRCIEACEECASECQTCADACRDMPGMEECARLCTECREECDRCVEMMKQGSSILCATCADSCDACAAECDKHAEHHDHCRRCAEACRACSTVCREMAA